MNIWKTREQKDGIKNLTIRRATKKTKSLIQMVDGEKMKFFGKRVDIRCE